MKSYHKFPQKYFDNPHLIEWIYRWNNLILQRNWHTKKELNLLFKSLPNDSIIVDAGSGEGQHLIPFAQKYPNLNFQGVDIEVENIDFTTLYTNTLNLKNTTFVNSDLIVFKPQKKVDLIYIIGVLQYVPKDEKLLQHFHNQLNPNGQLFIYSPVNERTIIRYLNTLRNKYFHYEKAQNRSRIYKKEELIIKLKKANFKIKKCDYKFGTLGIISHEIYSIILLKIENTHSKIKLILLLTLLIAILPYLILLKIADFYRHHKMGNAVVVIAEKKRD
jgi:2-polyprenyl-3-methyl-5-hydroxy-6-metoxy-1,4-benzoquinol methylase